MWTSSFVDPRNLVPPTRASCSDNDRGDDSFHEHCLHRAPWQAIRTVQHRGEPRALHRSSYVLNDVRSVHLHLGTGVDLSLDRPPLCFLRDIFCVGLASRDRVAHPDLRDLEQASRWVDALVLLSAIVVLTAEVELCPRNAHSILSHPAYRKGDYIKYENTVREAFVNSKPWQLKKFFLIGFFAWCSEGSLIVIRYVLRICYAT